MDNILVYKNRKDWRVAGCSVSVPEGAGTCVYIRLVCVHQVGVYIRSVCVHQVGVCVHQVGVCTSGWCVCTSG